MSGRRKPKDALTLADKSKDYAERAKMRLDVALRQYDKAKLAGPEEYQQSLKSVIATLGFALSNAQAALDFSRWRTRAAI